MPFNISKGYSKNMAGTYLFSGNCAVPGLKYLTLWHFLRFGINLYWHSVRIYLYIRDIFGGRSRPLRGGPNSTKSEIFTPKTPHFGDFSGKLFLKNAIKSEILGAQGLKTFPNFYDFSKFRNLFPKMEFFVSFRTNVIKFVQIYQFDTILKRKNTQFVKNV